MYPVLEDGRISEGIGPTLVVRELPKRTTTSRVVGRHRAHPCSSGAPAPERGRIRRSCPTEMMSARRIYRSAGACPPRTLDLRENRSGPVARGPSPATRACERVSPANARVPGSLARDRPSPYVTGWRFFTVARGPVPREHQRQAVAF